MILKKNNWNIDKSLEEFYKINKKSKGENKEVIEIYNKYKDQNSDIISGEGIVQFCNDLGIELEDPVILVISYYFKA